MSITAAQLKAAAFGAGKTRIEHHECTFCHYPCAYLIAGEVLYFDAGCDCGISTPPEAREWQSAADWVNMQSTPEGQARVAARFGLHLGMGIAIEKDEEGGT